MENLSKRLNRIVEKFIEESVSKETREEFRIATIHFNVDLNECSKYDLMRIDHKAKELAMGEENKLLSTAAIFSYILYRRISKEEFNLEEQINIKLAMLNISTTITNYLTYRIGEEEMNNNLFVILSDLNI